MPIVDENRLKGNWGAAHVAERLSGLCLVRPVSADTDVGLDLYCESIEGSQPFLHFWMQVKSGAQCRVASNGLSASCSFSVDHLEYWRRQPVPVFAAIVPSEPSAAHEPHVYIIDVAQHLLQSDIRVDQETQTLASQYIWRSGDEESVSAFLEQQISTTTALLKLRDGVVAPVPSLEDAYFKAIPMGPVSRFSDTILTQIRRTAAFSVLSLKNVASPSPETDSFRRRLARVAAQFDDDDHWETYAARAFSYHVDGQYEHAVEQYDRALDIIERDPNTDGLLEWESRVLELQRDREKAERGQDL